jgi:hypothetical protein
VINYSLRHSYILIPDSDTVFKREINNMPFKEPMRDNTTKRYVMTMVCLLAFFLRIELGKVPYGNPVVILPTAASNAAAVLLNALKGQKLLPLAIHRLIISILQEPRLQGGSALPSIVSLFIIFRNTMPSGMIKHPEDVSATLSELKWPFRGSSFWDIVQKLGSVAISDSEVMEGDSGILRSVIVLAIV